MGEINKSSERYNVERRWWRYNKSNRFLAGQGPRNGAPLGWLYLAEMPMELIPRYGTEGPRKEKRIGSE